ncbi:MAG: UDP-N-acetylmuramoyl-tripeptide--D-alanyl-D-alanine ligase [Clostridiales bacterium]|nr:UDP-N-acetylmuramoyl-tripeptide--D-alanyl-D-alanine ligase [Clostridiales bacterium]
MKQMSLKNIAEACGGRYFGDAYELAREVAGVVTDSRQVEEGFLYIPMRGERVDGHSFIPEVFGKGALATLSEEELTDPAGPYILVESCPQALKDIAEFYRSTLEIKIVGIAGSVGKTSTKEMIAAVLGQRYNVLKTEGNFNNEIGLPLTLLRIRPEHEVAVVEMGISDFGEMHRLAKMARPDICVMTNIGECHLENLIDRDGVLAAKSEIFDYLDKDGVIILNGNDDKLSSIEEENGIIPIRYFVEDGTANHMNEEYFVKADSIVNHGLLGMEATLHFPDEDCTVTEPIPGAHNIYNACAAACVGDVLGLTHREICAGIASAKTLAGRANLIVSDGMIVIDDCYNANPVSMRASLDVLALAGGRKIAVLGDMGELGENERELHRQVGEYAAAKGIDLILCAGELSEELAKGAGEFCESGKEAADDQSHSGIKPCEIRHFADRDELLADLLKTTKKGDTVLVKASHFMDFPKIVAALRNR